MRQYYGIDLLNDAEGITEYTREVIQDVLSAAATSGISFDEIVRQLETSTELSAMRARRIARTEVVSAANTASLINAQETDVPMVKIWLAVDDKRTRRSHRFVDDQTVPLDTPFNVGGVQMMQPGVRKQPSGLSVPASEVVNCRCVLGYKVVEGSSRGVNTTTRPVIRPTAIPTIEVPTAEKPVFVAAKTWEEARKFAIDNKLAFELDGYYKGDIDTLNTVNKVLYESLTQHNFKFDKIVIKKTTPKILDSS
jgi:hypothetical protein